MPARRDERQDTIPDIGRDTTAAMRNSLVLLLAACGGEPRVATPHAPIAPVARAQVAPVPWNLAFERGCHGSMTAPIVAPDQTLFGLCDAVFAYETGEYAGEFPVGAMAFVGAGILAESYSGRGLELDARSLDAGMGRGTVLSPDRTRALTVIEDGKQRTILLVALPSLDKLAAVSVTGGAQLGFLAGGTPIVLAHGTVSRLEGTKLVTIANAPRGIERMTVAHGGTRAVIARDARRAIVELPTWRELLTLPPPGDDEVRPEEGIALSDRGDRVAFVTGESLVIAAIDPVRGLVELHRRPFGMPEGLTFSPDGKSLLARAGMAMQVLREGAATRILAPVYRPALPPGFTLTFERGGTGDSGDGIERHDGGEELMQAGAFARYRNDDVTVTAYATDAAELGTSATSLDVWAARAVARHHDNPARSKRWLTSRGRALEYATFVRDGCDPVDRYIRVDERDGIVVRVEIEVPPGWSRKRVLPQLHAFFDGAFGAPKQRELAAAPRPPRGGC
jgi:hypothetical protein